MQEQTLEVETNQRESMEEGRKTEKFKRWVKLYLQLSAW